MIYISSGGDRKKTGEQFAREAEKYGMSDIELSGGAYDGKQLAGLKSIKNRFNFQVHNYFPPPEAPFVLNLASQNPEIASQSISHILKAMQWSVELDNPRYSFHAGFLIDLKIDELGKVIRTRQVNEREQSLKIFIERLNSLSIEAEKLGVELLIENNVLSGANYNEFGSNPLLMATQNECSFVMNNTPENINLLIDVAHLKVTAYTLGFDPFDFLDDCRLWTEGYHLSDNDGLFDSNEMFTQQSWFWPKLNNTLDYFTLEIYNVSMQELKTQLNLAKNKLEFLG